MATRRMADLRNIYSNKDAKRAGFDAYISIGRAPLEPSKSGDA
jgi:UDPglucose 6-dehydrogenase